MSVNQFNPTDENPLQEVGRSTNRLYRVIIAAAILFAVLLNGLLQYRGGPGPAIVVLPWFVPVTSLFNAAILFAVAFLAIGRAKVLQDTVSFWIGQGAVGLSIAFAFYALTWPGLLPGGGAIFGRLTGTSAWFLNIGLTLFSFFLLLAVTMHRPNKETLAGSSLLFFSVGWLILLVIAFSLMVRAASFLPELITSTGVFSPVILGWNAVLAILMVLGAVLSTYRYLKTGDILLGNIAIIQTGFAFALFATLNGMRRYDFNWYLGRTVLVISILVVLIVLIFEYVRLIRREKERTDQVLRAEKGLRESRTMLKAALASMTDAVFISNMQGRFIDYNRAFEIFHRFRGEDERLDSFVEYTRALEVFFPDGRPAPIDMWVVPRALRGETVSNAEYTLRRKDTGRMWTGSFSCGPIRDRSGIVIGAVIVGRDITERKRAEELLRTSEEHFRNLADTLEQQVAERTALAENRARQLQALAVDLIEAEERERRRIAYLLHDDLQQLLASANMQLQGYSQSRSHEAVLANIEYILQEAIAKSRNLSLELSPPVLHHSGLIAALNWLIKRMGEQFNLAIELEVNGQQPADVPLKTFIIRTVQELLFNIVKHAEVKSARIELNSHNDSLHITVSDQGRGFTPAILNNPLGEAGFGLLSIRERATYIGGNLLVESAPGQGSRITLEIPLSPSKIDHEAFIAPIPEQQSAALSNIKMDGVENGIRVLFADDHQVMRQGLIKLIAGQPGIQVVGEAADGRQAVERARQLKPDVVVMDISMPKMDGIEATRLIKTEQPQIRVIGLSMHEDEHIAESMSKAGAESFLSKTASPAEFLKAIYGISAGELPTA